MRGHDRSNGADSSKFRFWVRAKGFRLGPPGAAAADVGGGSTSSTSPSSGSNSSAASSTSSSNGGLDDDNDHVVDDCDGGAAAPAVPVDDLYVVTSTVKVRTSVQLVLWVLRRRCHGAWAQQPKTW